MKALNLPKESQEALLNGASMFIIPALKIISDTMGGIISIKEYRKSGIGQFIDYYDIDFERHYCFNVKLQSPYQIGDEVYIKRINIENGELICPICGFWCLGTGGQGCINKPDLYYNEIYFIIKDIKVVRVQKIAKKGYFDGADIDEQVLKGLGFEWIGYFNRESYEEIGYKLFKYWYNKQYNKYEDNPYVFLYTVERK